MTVERQIVDAAARMRRQREPHLVATVVRVHGPVYRRPGARMLLTQFRWLTASATGSYLEGDIAKHGWSATQGGRAVVLAFDARRDADASDDDLRSALGLGSDGSVEVLIERAGTAGRIDPLEVASECLRSQTRGAIATVIASRSAGVVVGRRVAIIAGAEPRCDVFDDELLRTAMIADARAAIATGTSSNRTYATAQGRVDVLVEAVLPPPRLFVLGTGHDAIPIVQLAHNLGWDVAVCTDESRVGTRQRFCLADEILVGSPAELAARIDACDRAVAIVMNHEVDLDRDQLGMLLCTSACYIGVHGPRARTSQLLADLGVSTVDPRVHAPAGLAIGAETTHEAALAIIAEMQSVLARAPARGLREHIGQAEDHSMPLIAEQINALAVDDAPAVTDLPVFDVEPVRQTSRELAAVVPVA
jgi:xanthine dehydrogenase accessory factor